MSELSQQVRRRRTFAFISHPDAGKTTLTEKLLLFSGAIQIAGSVKARKASRHATSDWMEIEKQRGISVASSVMQMLYRDHVINLLDTPGHEDFSEDTYRTLTAVDAAVMVLDAAKGIEAQTLKLFEVCRLRDIPIITFINKMDREGRDPLELLDEIEKTLALDVSPAAWPVGQGRDLIGVYDLLHPALRMLDTADGSHIPLSGLEDPALDKLVPAALLGDLRDQAGLVTGGYPEFDEEAFLQGTMTPVFFGSALRDFGVGHLLDGLARLAPPPRPRAADARMVAP
eukprot:gene45314-55438_t